MQTDILKILTFISKFDKKVKPELFLSNGFVKLNGKTIKTNAPCSIGDSLQLKKEQHQFDWDLYTVCK